MRFGYAIETSGVYVMKGEFFRSKATCEPGIKNPLTEQW